MGGLALLSRSGAGLLGYGCLDRSRAEADQLLIRSALQDGAVLGNAQRNIANTIRGFEPKFVNLDKAGAQLVCERFRTRSQDCKVIGP